MEDAGDARELDAEEAPQAGNQSLHVLHTRNVCRRICTQARGGRLVCSLEYHIGEESSPSLSTTITVQRALGTIRFANRAPGGTGRQHGRIYAICKVRTAYFPRVVCLLHSFFSFSAPFLLLF